MKLVLYPLAIISRLYRTVCKTSFRTDKPITGDYYMSTISLSNSASSSSCALSSTLREDLSKPSESKKPKKGQVRSIPGYRDFSLQEETLFTFWKKAVASSFESFGFVPMEPRPVELVSNLLLKGGLDKEIYGMCRAEDGTPVKVGLPFDRTLPLALKVAQSMDQMTFPYKRYDISYSFRGEKAMASAGRYRGFIQADVDIIDRNLAGSVTADAACYATVYHTFKRLNFPKFTMHINHIKIANAILKQLGFENQDDRAKILHLVDKLDKTPKEEVAKELLQMFPRRKKAEMDRLLSQFSYVGDIDEAVFEEGLSAEALAGVKELANLFHRLEQLGVPRDSMIYNARMVRGLNYYTGTVVETLFDAPSNPEHQYLTKCGSIASGGRYDKLVDTFVGRATEIEGVGISIGLTRVFDVLTSLGIATPKRIGSAQVLVGHRTEEEENAATKAAGKIRELGIATDLYTARKKIKKQFSYANKLGIPYCFMVMGSKSFVVKNLQTKEQQEYETMDGALAYIKKVVEQHLEASIKIKEEGKEAVK